MRKILMFLSLMSISLFLSGCGTNKMATCTNEVISNGMITKTTYDIEYNGNDVKHMKITYHYMKDDSVDGVGTGTDGSSSDIDNNDIDGNVDSSDSNDSNEVVDGAVGDAVDTVTDTILDLSGIRDTYNNQINSYRDIKGFSSDIEIDNDDEYKVVYEIDYDKISDSDLSLFNASRDYETLRNNYESQGLTCK